MTQKRKLDDSEVISTAEAKAARLETHMLENRNGCGTQLFTRDLKKYHYASSKSKAAKFNAHTLRKLQAAVDKDPEINLITHMPMDYSARLVEFQEEFQEKAKETIGRPHERTKPTQG